MQSRGMETGAGTILTIALVALLTCSAATATAAPKAGSDGLGDPLLPRSGNGGYDVEHYDLDFDWRPGPGTLRGQAAISARAAIDLSSFNLDLRRRMRVSRVEVNGEPAAFQQGRGELRITPGAALTAAEEFSVAIDYRGAPRPLRRPGLGTFGWIGVGRGAFVANEPNGASSWYPVNDHPLDKATYRISAGVPRDLVAVSNGELQSARRGERRARFTWRTREPMASYVTTLTIGRFETARPRIAGLPSFIAWDRGVDFDQRRFARRSATILRLFGRHFGPYPLRSTGAIIFSPVSKVGYALETQNRPLYEGDPLIGSGLVIAHELAHQWFGNSVTLSSWDELWLNEGFATWAEWFADEKLGGRSLERSFEAFYGPKELSPAEQKRWQLTIGAIPDRKSMFDPMVYNRGGLALQALGEKIGRPALLRILRAWATENRFGNVTTAQFIALAERESGRDLSEFFDVWLFQPGRPESW